MIGASLTLLNSLPTDEKLTQAIFAQLTNCVTRTTKNNKPYLEVTISDSQTTSTFKVWSDRSWYDTLLSLPLNSFISIDGEWSRNEYGLDINHAKIRLLSEPEIDQLFEGGNSDKVQHDWNDILKICNSVQDPRLKALLDLLLSQYGDRMKRSAAARSYHHARRGGLVEHIAGMLRAGAALAPLYPEINKDLLLTGIVFHDIGKLLENCYGEHSFHMEYTPVGELLGHIPMGVQIIDSLFNQLISLPIAQNWKSLTPSTTDVHIHLLHLIVSHHGELAFGSPVLPKTPEAMLLHFIDNIDAKMEMFRMTYAKGDMVADNLYRRTPPLPTNLFKPLPSFKED